MLLPKGTRVIFVAANYVTGETFTQESSTDVSVAVSFSYFMSFFKDTDTKFYGMVTSWAAVNALLEDFSKRWTKTASEFIDVWAGNPDTDKAAAKGE